jgi:hypothetical protein
MNVTETTEHAPHHHDRSDEKIIVDGQEYLVGHGSLNGRRVLEIANRNPIDEYIVLWLGPDNVLDDLGLDQAIHTRDHQVREFFTFQSDRSYRFDLDARRQDWGAPFITEETLRRLAGVGVECRVWQEFAGQGDRLLKPGERADLRGEGIEKFRIETCNRITVVNEDNGKQYELVGFNETKISTLIAETYHKLCVTRQDDDRLRCEGGGDVFQYADLTLGAYLGAGHCHCLVWLFAGGTGGAFCR